MLADALYKNWTLEKAEGSPRDEYCLHGFDCLSSVSLSSFPYLTSLVIFDSNLSLDVSLLFCVWSFTVFSHHISRGLSGIDYHREEHNGSSLCLRDTKEMDSCEGNKESMAAPFRILWPVQPVWLHKSGSHFNYISLALTPSHAQIEVTLQTNHRGMKDINASASVLASTVTTLYKFSKPDQNFLSTAHSITSLASFFLHTSKENFSTTNDYDRRHVW